MVDGLPSDSPVWREERWRSEEWTQGHEIAAEILEAMDRWGYRLFSQLGGKFKGKYVPLEFPRPGSQDPEKRKGISLTDQGAIARWFMSNN